MKKIATMSAVLLIAIFTIGINPQENQKNQDPPGSGGAPLNKSASGLAGDAGGAGSSLGGGSKGLGEGTGGIPLGGTGGAADVGRLSGAPSGLSGGGQKGGTPGPGSGLSGGGQSGGVPGMPPGFNGGASSGGARESRRRTQAKNDQLHAYLLAIRKDWSKVKNASRVARDLQATLKDVPVRDNYRKRILNYATRVFFPPEIVLRYDSELFIDNLRWMEAHGLIAEIEKAGRGSRIAGGGQARGLVITKPVDMLPLPPLNLPKLPSFVARSNQFEWSIERQGSAGVGAMGGGAPRLDSGTTWVDVSRRLASAQTYRGVVNQGRSQILDHVQFSVHLTKNSVAIVNAFPTSYEAVYRNAAHQAGVEIVLVVSNVSLDDFDKRARANPQFNLPSMVNVIHAGTAKKHNWPAEGYGMGEMMGGGDGGGGAMGMGGLAGMMGGAGGYGGSMGAEGAAEMGDEEGVGDVGGNQAGGLAGFGSEGLGGYEDAGMGGIGMGGRPTPGAPGMASGFGGGGGEGLSMGGPMAGRGAARVTTHVLQHADAAQITGIIERFYKSPTTTCAADSRLNAIVVRADSSTAAAIIELVEQLDRPDDPAVAGRSPRQRLASTMTELETRYEHADAVAVEAAQSLRRAIRSNERRDKVEKLREALSDAVARSFEVRQELHTAQLNLFAKRVETLRTSIDMRERIREAIINRRVEHLMNPDSKWDGGVPRE